MTRPTAVQRFWSRVDASGGMDACWTWLGTRDSHGYGRLAYGGSPIALAHRVSASLAGIDGLVGMLVLHSCDNPPCVNPAHLRVGTHTDNHNDMVSRDRQPAQMRPRTHCNRGHSLTGANVTRDSDGRHRCGTCHRAARRARLHGSGEPVSTVPSALARGMAGMTGSPDSRKRESGGPLPPATE